VKRGFARRPPGSSRKGSSSGPAEKDPRYRDLPPVGRGLFIGTTHGWAFQNLRELGGIYETLDGLDDEQEWTLLLRVARRLGVVDLLAAAGGTKDHKVAAAPAIEVFLRSVDILYDEGLDASVLASREPDFARAVERYEWLLGEMRLLPFRSMIRRAAEELAPGGRLRQRLDGRISHVLVDEFQDMNRTQDRLLGHFLEMGADLALGSCVTQRPSQTRVRKRTSREKREKSTCPLADATLTTFRGTVFTVLAILTRFARICTDTGGRGAPGNVST